MWVVAAGVPGADRKVDRMIAVLLIVSVIVMLAGMVGVLTAQFDIGLVAGFLLFMAGLGFTVGTIVSGVL